MRHDRPGSRTEIQAAAFEDGKRAGLRAAARLARKTARWLAYQRETNNGPFKLWREPWTAEDQARAFARELARRGRGR